MQHRQDRGAQRAEYIAGTLLALCSQHAPVLAPAAERRI